jgi:hypothetical protein
VFRRFGLSPRRQLGRTLRWATSTRVGNRTDNRKDLAHNQNRAGLPVRHNLKVSRPQLAPVLGPFLLATRVWSLVHRRLAWRRSRSFQYFDLAAIMDVLGDLGEIAHIEPLRTDRALFKVIGLGLSDPVAVVAFGV